MFKNADSQIMCFCLSITCRYREFGKSINLFKFGFWLVDVNLCLKKVKPFQTTHFSSYMKWYFSLLFFGRLLGTWSEREVMLSLFCVSRVISHRRLRLRSLAQKPLCPEVRARKQIWSRWTGKSNVQLSPGIISFSLLIDIHIHFQLELLQKSLTTFFP